jgi:ketosteroid isomerase-like protein
VRVRTGSPYLFPTVQCLDLPIRGPYWLRVGSLLETPWRHCETAMKIVRAMVLLTMVAAFALQAATQSGDETRILALENAWNRALELHDVQSVAGLVDDRLINIHDDGRLENKAEYLARVGGTSSHNEELEQAVNESQAARSYGNCAVVTGLYRAKGVKDGKPYLLRMRFSDTWVYRDGKWVIVASQVTRILH